ncbi:MAG TPA: hypothetical protein VEI97_17225, partial [bacterium]|nr:hypothetical protein [bacterium]
TARIREFIQNPDETAMIKTAMEEGKDDGMMTFDQYLLALYRAKKITYKTALRAASSPHDFQLLERKTTHIDAPITQSYYGSR